MKTTAGEPLPAGPPVPPIRHVESAGIERWLDLHSGLVSLIVIAVGLAIRLLLIRGAYLDADEATHFELANVPLADLYRSTLTEAHPPLFFLLLHFWLLLGNSESFLRLLSVLFGAAFLAVAYGWSARLFGKSTAFFTLAIFAFSPAFVSSSAEVRGYSLLLLLMVSTLGVLERAISLQSVRAIICFSGLLYLTILTHYSALWFTLAIFVYVLARIRGDRLPARIVGAWLVTQFGAAMLYVLLYFTHVAKLRGGELERHAMTRWLRPAYFHADQEGVLDYLGRQTIDLFRSLLGSSTVTYLGLALAAMGIALLAWRRRPAALLLGLPFILGAGAGLAGIYPYGGTRHSVYLLVFAAAAIGVAGAALTMARVWPALVLIAVLAPVSHSLTPSAQGRSLIRMNAAMDTLRSAAPPGNLLFADLRTGAVLYYYLGRNELNQANPSRAGFRQNVVGGYRLVRSPVWSFNDKGFSSEWRRFVEVYGLAAGQTVWLVRMGSEYNPRAVLAHQYPVTTLLREFRVGEISVVELRIPEQ